MALDYETTRTEILILGGGGASIRAAIEADQSGISVVLVNKGAISRSGLTPMAGSAYQAAFAHSDPRDNGRVHFEDTAREGHYLGDENLIHTLTREAMDRALELERYGVRFIKKNDRFVQVRHPGQTFRRLTRSPDGDIK